MKLSQEYFILALSICIFVVAAAVPTYVYLTTARAKAYVAEVENRLGDARSREATARTTRQILADTAHEREVLEEASVASDGAALLINTLERDAKAAGISFEIGGVSVEPSDGALDMLKVSMRAEGTFATVLRALSLVETIPYVATINTIALERNDKGVWSSTTVISVVMRKKI